MLPSHSRPLGPRSSSLAAADDDHDGAFQTNRLLNPHYHAADDNSPHPYTQDTEFGLLDRRHFQRSPKGSEQELPLHSARGAGAGMSNVQVHGGQAKRRGAGGVSNGINGAVASDPAGSTPAFEGHVHDHPHEQDDGRGLDKGMKGGVADAGGYATYAEARVKRSWEKQVPEYKASQNPVSLESINHLRHCSHSNADATFAGVRRLYSPDRLHCACAVHPIIPHRSIQHGRMGRSALWQIRSLLVRRPRPCSSDTTLV